jgi:methylthioribose-1-phosphate isomerase
LGIDDHYFLSNDPVLQEERLVINENKRRTFPYHLVEDLHTVNDVAVAIKEMHVRGAGLIGAAAGYGMYLAALKAPDESHFDKYIIDAGMKLTNTRPTAVNLHWAVEKQIRAIKEGKSISEKIDISRRTAEEIANEDVESCKKIGNFGMKLIERISEDKNGATVNILTHCNAGWLAFVDYGTALSPIYTAFEKGIDVHVWVDETRPRNQGARLTAWELGNHGVPHTIISDNLGGHLMQNELVDLVIVGSDRTTYTGDVANKIGTYLKALAASDNRIPFYVALPSSTIDWEIEDGLTEIPIEEREDDEVKYIGGLCEGHIKKVLLTPKNSKALNYGFDVTPSRLITGLITERGICRPDEKNILELFPERIRSNG